MKKHLLTGLVILLPIALTLLVIDFLFEFFTAPFVPLFRYLLGLAPVEFPPSVASLLSHVMGIFLLLLLILALGFIAQHFLLKNILDWTNRIIARIPFIKSIYKVVRQVIRALFSSDGRQAFQEPVMYPFPHKPHQAIGFLAGNAPKECEEKVGRKLATVFAPTAPHPISGFLFLIPKEDISKIDMNKEDAVKFLVSCGVVTPENDNLHDHL